MLLPKKCAIYCRVSTSGQDIKTQVDVLPKFAKKQGWDVFDVYIDDGISGASMERPEFKRLMEDTIRNKFDIILCESHDRLSRTDNMAERGMILQTIKENNVMIWSPSEGACDLSEFSGELISQFKLMQAAKEKEDIFRRTMKGKRAKVESGFMSFGMRKPYARIYDKETGKWTVDQEKKIRINKIADQYLAGKSLDKLSSMIDLTYCNLLKTLRERSGKYWNVIFDGKELSIDVGRLLSDKKIQMVKERINSNKTFTHGDYKHKYLFSSLVICGHCGYALQGIDQKGNKYYRHSRNFGCPFFSITASHFEDQVMQHIFDLFGDVTLLEQAQMDAIPNLKEIRRLQRELKDIKQEISDINIKKNKLVDILEVSNKDMTVIERLKDYSDKIEFLNTEVMVVENKLRNVPSKNAVKMKAQLMRRMFKGMSKSQFHLDKMTFDEKKKLLHTIFSGKDADGKRLGVYFWKDKTKKQPWFYEIRGGFKTDVGRLSNNKVIIKSVDF